MAVQWYSLLLLLLRAVCWVVEDWRIFILSHLYEVDAFDCHDLVQSPLDVNSIGKRG